MEIRYSKQAGKYIKKQDYATKERIKIGIEGLTKTPMEGDISAMKDTSMGDLRLRIGGTRVIFNFAKNIKDGKEVKVLSILKIGNRGDVYK